MSRRALDAGPYELHLLMGDGSKRKIEIQIEAGRVNDVVIDLAA